MLRTFGIFLIELVSTFFLASILPGFEILNFWGAIIFVITVGALNALVRPFLIRITLPLTVLTLGLFSLILNGFLVLVAVYFVPYVEVNNIISAIVLSISLASVNSFFNAIFAIDDTDSYYRNVIKKQAKKVNIKEKDRYGIIFLEIDGLAKPIFSRAMQNGYMPTMARWLRESHDLVGWETDLASSTPASQAGILHGNNDNIPAYRWFDRKTQSVVSMSDPKKTSEQEALLTQKNALLRGGMSINNMFSGGAKYCVLTVSRLLQKGSTRQQKGLYYYFLNPYNFSRSIALSVADIIHEIRDASFQKRQGVEPRLNHRGGKYPLIRAVNAIVMRDIATNTVVGDILTGLPSVYASYTGYDEVAHHAGIERSEAMYTLTQLDKQFAKIEKSLDDAPRPYHLVVLSDHGQSQGSTFLQRYGLTLEEYVTKLLEGKATVYDPGDSADEGSTQLNKMLLQIANEDTKAANTLAQKAVESKTISKVLDQQEKPSKIVSDVVVLPSGNLGLIYFTRRDQKMSLEDIDSKYPNLVQKLVNHSGVGFVVVSSSKGDLAIGAKGIYNLKTNVVVGTSPIESYGVNAAKHLRRSSKFDNSPDILIISLFDPQTEEVAAFEELVGSHGGLGGTQSQPFIFYPKSLDSKKMQGIVGAESLNRVFLNWMSDEV